MAETATDKPKKATRRTIKSAQDVPDASKTATFLKKMGTYSSEDWGARIKVYCYRVEPVIDRTRSGELKYIMSYSEPISEDRLLADHGSGRYKLILNFRKPGVEVGDEIDSVYIEIMNPKFPPKMSLGDWVDDARNKKWAWAKEILEDQERKKATPQVAESVTDQLRVFNEIQDSAIERARANTPTQADPVQMFKGFMDLMPKPAPASENGMFTAMVAMMTQQMQQQGQIMQAQIAAGQAEAKELRSELREMRTKPNGLGTFKEIIGEVKTLMPDIKEFFPAADARPRGTPWWVGTLERIAEGVAPVIPLVVQQMMANANAQRQPQTHQNGAQPVMRPGVAAPQPQQTTTPGTQIDVDAALLSAMDADRTGEDFADFLNTMYGDDGRRLYTGLVQMGELGLIQLIQSRPIWDRLGPHQARLPEFVKQFIAWDTPEPDNQDGNVIDAQPVEVL